MFEARGTSSEGVARLNGAERIILVGYTIAMVLSYTMKLSPTKINGRNLK